MIHLPGHLPRIQADRLAEKLRRKENQHYVCTGVRLPNGQKVWRICLESELVQTAHRCMEGPE